MVSKVDIYIISLLFVRDENVHTRNNKVRAMGGVAPLLPVVATNDTGFATVE